jgi:hypothetical protein
LVAKTHDVACGGLASIGHQKGPAFQLTAERVEDVARFVSGIGQRLTPDQEGIQEAVESANASGFNLEHIEDIRYGIRSEIWEGKAVSLSEFADGLGKQLSAMSR